jgi:hypothetical protein
VESLPDIESVDEVTPISMVVVGELFVSVAVELTLSASDAAVHAGPAMVELTFDVMALIDSLDPNVVSLARVSLLVALEPSLEVVISRIEEDVSLARSINDTLELVLVPGESVLVSASLVILPTGPSRST